MSGQLRKREIRFLSRARAPSQTGAYTAHARLTTSARQEPQSLITFQEFASKLAF